MKSMVLNGISSLEENKKPLEMVDLPDPVPGEREILVKVTACGVCHTELDEIEGRTPPPRFPIVLGHEIVGIVQKKDSKINKFKIGDRVGIGWIHSVCGQCTFCLEGQENLCEEFKATGRDANGGYAEYTVVPEDFAFKIPGLFSKRSAMRPLSRNCSSSCWIEGGTVSAGGCRSSFPVLISRPSSGEWEW